MNNETRKQILESICTETFNRITEKPYQITTNGQVYEFATDGIILLAFSVERSELPSVPASDGAEIKQAIIRWLSAKPEKIITEMGGQHFADFLNLNECAKCPSCKGSGNRSLDSIDSDGWLNDPFDVPRYVRIDNRAINANRLASVLVHLDWRRYTQPLGYRQELTEETSVYCHTFFGDGWIVVIADCREGSADEQMNWTGFEAIEKEIN